jgi:hypothetical protein
MDFLSSTDVEILNQGNEPTFCSGGRQELIDITLASRVRLEIITGWGVSSDHSLSNHSHILFILRGSWPVLLISNPRGTVWEFFREELKMRLEKGP